MVMVLDTVGLPAEDVTIILAVDWLLDRLDSKKGRGNNADRREGGNNVDTKSWELFQRRGFNK